MASPEGTATSAWAILTRPLHLTADPEAPTTALHLASPPQISVLSASHRLVLPPEPTARVDGPRVLTSSDGLVLFTSTEPRGPGPLHIKKGDREVFSHRDSLPALILADLSKPAGGPAFRLPDPEFPVSNAGLLGVATRTDPTTGGVARYVVAEFVPVLGGKSASLLRYYSDTGEWVERDDGKIRNPLPYFRFPRWSGVTSCYGKLWWADVSWGLVYCDPFDETPELRFVELPLGSVIFKFHCEGPDVHDERFIGVSEGQLKYVELSPAEGTVSMWTLSDAMDPEWTRDFQVPLASIWADESYKATGLPNEVPVPTVVHPFDASLLYFLLEGRIFGVNVRTMKLEGCSPFEPEYVYPRALQPVVLPPGFACAAEPIPQVTIASSKVDEVSSEGNTRLSKKSAHRRKSCCGSH